MPVLVRPTCKPVVYLFVASASFGPVLLRRKATRSVRTSCASVNKILIVSSMNSRSGMVRGSATHSGSWIFDVEFNELNPRIRSSHLFQRTFASSRDDDLVAFPCSVSAKSRPMPEPPPVIKIVLPVRFIVYS